MKIGKPLPEFTMTDQNGKDHSLSDHEGEIVVLQFASQNCPLSRAADPVISKLSKTYGKKGVVFYGIDSDTALTAEDVKSYSEEHELSYVTLIDENNVYADKLNAKTTPEFYIVDKEGKLAYHGAFDDREDLDDPDAFGTTNFVANALDSLLTGEKIKQAEVKSWGCAIKRVKT